MYLPPSLSGQQATDGLERVLANGYGRLSAGIYNLTETIEAPASNGGYLEGVGSVPLKIDSQTESRAATVLRAGTEMDGLPMIDIPGANYRVRDLALHGKESASSVATERPSCGIQMADTNAAGDTDRAPGVSNGSHLLSNITFEELPVGASMDWAGTGPRNTNGNDHVLLSFCRFRNCPVGLQLNNAQAVSFHLTMPIFYGLFGGNGGLDAAIDARAGGDVSVSHLHAVCEGLLLRIWTDGSGSGFTPGRTAGVYEINGGRADDNCFDNGNFAIVEMEHDPEGTPGYEGSSRCDVNVRGFHIGNIDHSWADGTSRCLATMQGASRFRWYDANGAVALGVKTMTGHETTGDNIPWFVFVNSSVPSDPRTLIDTDKATGRVRIIWSDCMDSSGDLITNGAWEWSGTQWNQVSRIALP